MGVDRIKPASGGRVPDLLGPATCRTGDTAMVTIHGIKNCDTIRKARGWLDAHGVAHVFHDYRQAGIDVATLARWSAVVGWERLLNRAGTTFRALSEEERAGLDEDAAIALMVAHPAMIKRPVLEAGDTLLVGFKPEAYAAAGLQGK